MFQPNCSFGEVAWPGPGRAGAKASATPSARAARRARRRVITDMADPGAVGELGLGHRPRLTQRYAGARRRVEGRRAPRARVLRSGRSGRDSIRARRAAVHPDIAAPRPPPYTRFGSPARRALAELR